jgi:hypothetical protein
VDSYPTSTLGVTHAERDDGPRRIRSRRISYGVTTLALALLVTSAVVDNASEVDIWGVSTDHVDAAGDGYELDVRYATVTRPAMATPFDILIHRDGGFSGPVDVAVAPELLEIWDFQALYPAPSSEVATPDEVIFTFDPPDGEDLRIFLDARVQPAQQSGVTAFVAVLDGGGDRVVAVEFHIAVRP